MVPQCCNKLDKWTRRTRCRFENGIQLGLWNPNLAHQSSNLHKLDTSCGGFWKPKLVFGLQNP
jgi:hypothetical protein